MTYIQERGSTHVYHVNRMSKEEMDHMISLCVHDQPAYCVAACPFKVDTKEMLFYAAKGNFKKALAIYEKITPFPMILCDGCTAPCEEKCKLCEIGDGVSIREVERAIVRYGESGKRSSRSPVRPLCNRKRFSCLPPQAKMSWILYAISMRLSDRRIASCSR